MTNCRGFSVVVNERVDSVPRVVGYAIQRIAGNLQYVAWFLLVVHSGWDSFDWFRACVRDLPLSLLQHLVHQLPAADAII
jgi:hypothetical protein